MVERASLQTLDRDLRILTNSVESLDKRTKSIETKIDSGFATKHDLAAFVTKAEFRPVAYFVYFVMVSLGGAVLASLWSLVMLKPTP